MSACAGSWDLCPLWLGQSEVVQHSLDHDRLPCLPELQHAAGSRAVAQLRRETPESFWPGLVPQGSRDLESAHLVPDPAKGATGFLRPLPATSRFLSALTFSNLTMPTLVLPQVAQLSKNGHLDDF